MLPVLSYPTSDFDIDTQSQCNDTASSSQRDISASPASLEVERTQKSLMETSGSPSLIVHQYEQQGQGASKEELIAAIAAMKVSF